MGKTKYAQKIIHFFCRPCKEYHLTTHPYYRAMKRRAAKRQTAKNTLACCSVIALLLALWSVQVFAQDKVCTVIHDAPVITAFMSEDYDALMGAGMKDKAAKDVTCVVPKGSKVVIADFGASYVSAHVVSGPQDGCVGNLARPYYSCKH